MYRTNRVEIDLGTIAYNMRALRAITPRQTALMAVVKADAYGHGAVPVARTALANGAVWLGVALPEEGAVLREAGIEAPVLVLGGVERAGAAAAVRYNLTQTVFDSQTVRWLDEAAKAQDRDVCVHVKLDTGMGRIGLRTCAEVDALRTTLKDCPHVRLTGVFTHFAQADDDEPYTHAQHARFETLLAPLRMDNPALTVHCANSAALLRGMDFALQDLVRVGIALYGCAPVASPRVALRQAMRWVTRAVQVKTLEAGESVSYGRTFVADMAMRVMTLPVGYADGYHRLISNRGMVLVRGRRARVLGRVCMDQMMVDVTDIPGAAVGDEAVLMGAQGDDMITAQEVASWADTISYEMLLAPSARVPRMYHGDDEGT